MADRAVSPTRADGDGRRPGAAEAFPRDEPRATRADVCAVALAECFLGDGERLASPMGTLPTIGAHLARASFAPHLVLSDGAAFLSASTGTGAGEAHGSVEGWAPFRHVFDLCWSGRRHVVMGAAQIDRYGNQNIACIGPWPTPRSQLLGFRGAPGNSINHTTSYWIPRHSRRVFVDRVDVVCGIGHDRAREVGAAARFHDVRRVVSDLGVFDFDTPDRRMRLRSLHPGVTLEEVLDATGFDLAVDGSPVVSREPTVDEHALLVDLIDPAARREDEVPPR